MGYYTIFQDKGGKYRFNLHAANNQVILSSQGYASAAGRDNGIESVRVNSQIPERFERLDAKSGDFYFVLKAANAQVIGQSQMYKSKSGRDNGIESVMKNGPSKDVRPAE
ncbi:MAG: YegP family protein [Bacteroidota bacterium]